MSNANAAERPLGERPIEITSGELFCVAVAGEMQRTRHR
jgi:hypothetical protein